MVNSPKCDEVCLGSFAVCAQKNRNCAALILLWPLFAWRVSVWNSDFLFTSHLGIFCCFFFSFSLSAKWSLRYIKNTIQLKAKYQINLCSTINLKAAIKNVCHVKICANRYHCNDKDEKWFEPMALTHTHTLARAHSQNKKKLRDKTQNGKINSSSMMVEIESAYHVDWIFAI